MVEGGAEEGPEAVILEALTLAQKEIRKICEAQVQLAQGLNETKLAWSGLAVPDELKKAIDGLARTRLREAAQIQEKTARDAKVASVKELVKAQLAEKF